MKLKANCVELNIADIQEKSSPTPAAKVFNENNSIKVYTLSLWKGWNWIEFYLHLAIRVNVAARLMTFIQNTLFFNIYKQLMVRGRFLILATWFQISFEILCVWEIEKTFYLCNQRSIVYFDLLFFLLVIRLLKLIL